MKRTASRPVPRKRSGEDGFTLTELVAGLLVVSMLIVGLADITRRYAVTTMRVKEVASEVRTTRILQSLFAELERADPDSIEVSRDGLSATLGADRLEAKLARNSAGTAALAWTSPRISRTIRLPVAAEFERNAGGDIALRAGPEAPPLAMATPRRSVAFDCSFDTVVRECR